MVTRWAIPSQISGSPGVRRMAAGFPVNIPSGRTPSELLKNTLTAAVQRLG